MFIGSASTLGTGGSWSTGTASLLSPSGGSGSWSFGAPTTTTASGSTSGASSPGVSRSVGPFGEGSFTPNDYPAMRFLGEGESLEPISDAIRSAFPLLAVGALAFLLLRGK